MMERAKHHELFLLFAAMLMCPSAGATTFARMSLAEMSHAAPLIVRAKCVANTVDWEEGEIWTFTEFEVEETWRGGSYAQVMVRLLGGRLGNITSTVSGVPRFRGGEEVVLFLEHAPRGNFSIVSWGQGTFRIHRDQRTNEDALTQDTALFSTFDPATRQFAANGIKRQPVREFRARVETALALESARKP
jgi:hypothetical protein